MDIVTGRPSYPAFLRAHPEYTATASLDALRSAEYRRLDALGEVYLDYTGGSLAADAQVLEHAALLTAHVYGNPHSASPSSSATTALVERARGAVLDYFHAPASEYTAVFTANATGALKLVGESYPFAADSRLLLAFDNHNSVNGLREFAGARGARVEYAPLTVPDLRLDWRRLDELLSAADRRCANLFAYPAQSNFSGVWHPLDLVDQARQCGWDVLIDAAAFVPTSRLDLMAVRPDFVSISFYKMFGYPTGVGCLIARREALEKLTRPWFAGGTVNFASVQGRIHRLAPQEAGFEDGTLNYLGIPAVEIGLRHLDRIGIDTVRARVASLTSWLLARLVELRHGNGRPVVRIYGPEGMEARGGTVAFNFYDPDGRLLDYRRIEEMAGARGISLRTGCFCNPGAGEVADDLTESDMRAGLESGDDVTLPRFLQILQLRGGKNLGAIRVSLGLVSNFDDVDTFLAFASEMRDGTSLTIGELTSDSDSCRVIRDGA